MVVEVGDLVRLRKSLNFAPSGADILGIIVAVNQIASASTRQRGIKEEFLATEYEVSIVTSNKTAWYIEDSLELVSEGWGLGEKQSDG
jgi:hypothetical protein